MPDDALARPWKDFREALSPVNSFRGPGLVGLLPGATLGPVKLMLENLLASLRTRRDALALRYKVIVYWSEQDRAFIAEAPELLGCVADGQTYPEAIANLEVIIAEWIETAKLRGGKVPQQKWRLLFA